MTDEAEVDLIEFVIGPAFQTSQSSFMEGHGKPACPTLVSSRHTHICIGYALPRFLFAEPRFPAPRYVIRRNALLDPCIVVMQTKGQI